MENLKIYKIYDRSNGNYYSTFPENGYCDAVSELKISSYEKFIIDDEDDFYNLQSKWLKYYPDGDTYDEWPYYEPNYPTVVNGFDTEDNIPIISVIERFYNHYDTNISYFLKLPYTVYFIKKYEII